MRLLELLSQISNGASQIILIIIGIAVIAILLPRKGRALLRVKLRTGTEQVVGICATAIGLDAKKRENKEKIGTLLKDRGSLSNSDIREALGISERTAVRYMDELEREGKVDQVGSTGRKVTYRLK